MSWGEIARLDARELLRSRLVWLGALIVIGTSAVGASIPAVVGSSTPSYTVGTETGFISLALLSQFVAFGLGYRAVVGERESGSMRFLMGLPNRRWDIVLGKTVSRVAVAGLITGLGAVGVLVTLTVLYGSVSYLGPVRVLSSVLLIGVIYTILSVSISASSSSSTKSVVGVFGAFIIMFFLWDILVDGIHWALTGAVPGDGPQSAWYALLILVNPGNAAEELTYTGIQWMREGTYVSNASIAETVVGEAPFYLSEIGALVIVVGWLVVPLAVGYRRFQTAEPS